MPRRYYSSTAFAATLTADINNSVTSFAVSTVTGWPSTFPFTIIVDENTANEEVMEVTNRSGTTLTVTRGVDGTTAVSHLSGASVKHGVSARDFNEPNQFLNEGGTAGPATGGTFTFDGGASGTKTLVATNAYTPSSTTYFATMEGPNYFARWTTLGTNILEAYGDYFGITMRRGEGTAASPADTTAGGLTLAPLTFQGRLSGGPATAAIITGLTDTDVTGSTLPGRLVFSTAGTSTGATERMRIDSRGRTVIGRGASSTSALKEDNPLLTLATDMNALPTAQVTATFTNASRTMDVTAVTSGTIAVGHMVVTTSSPQESLYVEALGTGSGGTGTYTLNHPWTGSTGAQAVKVYDSARVPYIRIHQSNTGPNTGDPLGGIEFYVNEFNPDANHVRAGVYARSAGPSGGANLVLTATNDSFTAAPNAGLILDGNGLLSGTGRSLGPWTSFTPTLGGSGWGLGNGTLVGRYCQIGKTVYYRIRLVWGSTSTYSTTLAPPTLSPPVTPENALLAVSSNGHHNVIAVDTSAGVQHAMTGWFVSATDISLRLIGTNGVMNSPQNTTPFTWAAGDVISVMGTYEAA